jgi:hypothetical protein
MIKLLALLMLGATIPSAPESGLAIGDRVPAFHPKHVTGPDKGTEECPP